MQIRRVVPGDFSEVRELLCRELPEDPLFSLSRSPRVLQVILKDSTSNGSRQGWCLVSPTGTIVGFILIGERVSLLEAATVLALHFLRAPIRVVGRLPSIVLSAVGQLIGNRSGLGSSEIITLAVDSANQRRGLGSALLVHATHAFQLVLVKTLSRTPGSVLFYQNHGFVIQREAFGRVFMTRSS